MPSRRHLANTSCSSIACQQLVHMQHANTSYAMLDHTLLHPPSALAPHSRACARARCVRVLVAYAGD
jgi:hypothetical protein